MVPSSEMLGTNSAFPRPSAPRRHERQFINFPLALSAQKNHKAANHLPSMTTSSICSRSIAAAVAISLAALFSPSASAQTTATTVPVGFITKTLPPAPDAANPTTATISIPLYATADFTSAVASVDGANQFTMATANWGAGLFTATPHLVRIKTGLGVGRFFLISLHSTNQLTVILPPSVSTLVGLLAVGDSCEILPANTLSSVFGLTAPGFVTGSSANAADKVYLWSGTGWDTYFNNGTHWRKSGNFNNQDGIVIYPDEGIFISHIGSAALSLTLLGTVPSTPEKTDLDGAGITFISNRFPVDSTLVSTGLQSSPGWTTGSSANAADKVYLWNGSGWDTFFHNGTTLRKSGNFNPQDSTSIPTGSALYISRINASPSVLAQALPYTP